MNMKRRTKHIGLIIGTVMMTAVIGAGTVLAAGQPGKAVKSAASASAGDKGQGNKKDEKKEAKKETLFYGKVKKLEKEKIVLDGASVLPEKDAEGDKDTKVKDTGKDKSVHAEFEAGTMKWKLDGKTLEIKIDKNTKYMKSAPTGDAKAGDAAAGKKDETSGKNDKKDQKDSKTASKEGAKTEQSTPVELKDIQEGMFLKVTVKEDGSMTALEVLVLSDAKEIKPVG